MGHFTTSRPVKNEMKLTWILGFIFIISLFNLGWAAVMARGPVAGNSPRRLIGLYSQIRMKRGIQGLENYIESYETERRD